MKIHACALISFLCLFTGSFVFAHSGGGFRGGPPPHRGFQGHGGHQHGHGAHHGHQHRHHNDDYHHHHSGGRGYQKSNEGYGGNINNWGNDDRW